MPQAVQVPAALEPGCELLVSASRITNADGMGEVYIHPVARTGVPTPLPMDTAPRDGTMIRLLVRFTEHSTEDAEQAWTIGANGFDNDGEDVWKFAGWCWTHDHFTEGQGMPIGWLPMLDSATQTPAEGEEVGRG